MDAVQREVARLRGELATYANLFVASHRLHGARDRSEVLTVVQELVISVVGSEEFGIFELDEASSRLRPAATFGLDPASVEWVASVDDVVAECLADGRLRSATPSRALSAHGLGARLSAVVPLKLGERVVGLVAIFAMLPHKPELGTADLRLLELLSSHAATSLDYARLQQRELAWSSHDAAAASAERGGS